MSNKEVINVEVDSNIGEVSKDASGLASNFRIMGVSLNDVKKGFSTVGSTAKKSFATIRAGIASTGIGLLVIAVASLVTYFTNTKRGADQLERAFTAIGTISSVLIDRFSKIGEALTFVFKGDFAEAGKTMEGVFSGIADEVEREVKAMDELKKRTHELRDADNDFMVQKAATRKEIEKARLIAEDETKSAQERLDNLKKALDLEAETTAQELKLAKERRDVQIEEMALSENSAEDERKLAELKAEVIRTETASLKMRRRVVTEVNALEREIEGERTRREKERQKRIKDQKAKDEKAHKEEQAKIKATKEKEKKEAEAKVKFRKEQDKIFADTVLKNAQELSLSLIKDEDERAQKSLNIQKANELRTINAMKVTNEQKIVLRKQLNAKYKQLQDDLDDDLLNKQKQTDAAQIDLNFQTAQQLGSAASSLAGENKGIAAAVAIIDTLAGANKALGSAPPPLNFATAAAVLAAGYANVRKIYATDVGGGTSGGATPDDSTPAPSMTGGAFKAERMGFEKPDPIKAFVVTDEMTNSQDQLASIRRRATI